MESPIERLTQYQFPFRSELTLILASHFHSLVNCLAKTKLFMFVGDE
jgi:hypothetical protein